MSMTTEEMAAVVSSKRRQKVIQSLREEDTIPAGLMAERIAKIEDASRKACYIALIQHHLPKLDEKGVVEYDEQSKLFSQGPRFDTINRALLALESVREGRDERGFIASVKNMVA